MKQAIFIVVTALIAGFFTFAQANPPAGASFHMPGAQTVDHGGMSVTIDADHTHCVTDSGCTGCEAGLPSTASLDRQAGPARQIASGPRQSASPIREILKPPRA